MHRIFYTMEFNGHNVLHLDSYRSWAQSCNFFCELKPHAKREEKKAINSGHLVSRQRTYAAGTNVVPAADLFSMTGRKGEMVLLKWLCVEDGADKT